MMHAMLLEHAGRPLERRRIPIPVPGAGQILVKVGACGVCRTDLHVVDGELTRVRVSHGSDVCGLVR